MSASYTLRSRKRKSPDTDTSSTADESISIQPKKKRKLSVLASPSNTNTKSNSNSNSIANRETIIIDDSDDSDLNEDDITTSTSPSISHQDQEQDPPSPYIQFDTRSWCWADRQPFKSFIKVTNNNTESKGLKIFDVQKKRGHRIVVIDGITGDIEQSIVFDTWADIYSGIRLKIFLQTLQFKPNKWVIIITHDSGYNINTEVCCLFYAFFEF